MNNLVALLSIDFHLLETEVRKEQQARMAQHRQNDAENAGEYYSLC